MLFTNNPDCWDDRGGPFSDSTIYRVHADLGRARNVSLPQEQKPHQEDKINEYRANTHFMVVE